MNDSERSYGRRAEKPSRLQAGWWARACAAFMICAATAIVLPAQTFTTLHSFSGLADGFWPWASLIQASDGYLYGTTSGGGANGGGGTVFKIALDGTLTTLYTFCLQTGCVLGSFPEGALIQATDGNFYGTTIQGGHISPACRTLFDKIGCGTIFKITASGMLTTLYTFCSQTGCVDGASPGGALIQAADGNFYGTTRAGGAISSDCSALRGIGPGCGTIFKITPNGVLTTLYTFCSQSGCADGVSPPWGALVLGADGDLYGTTSWGGVSGACPSLNGCGTVFKITTSGALTTLHSFDRLDGAIPEAGLIQGAGGFFYGTTSGGGAFSPDCRTGLSYGCGTVFKMTPSGVLMTLHRFDGTDGADPTDGLAQGTDGNLYATTGSGGAENFGTVFEITPTGTLTTLYSFCSQSGCTDGSVPFGGLIQATDGNFYGTTFQGGASNYGTVFALSVGLGPFVKTQPAFGTVGKPVRILGTNLTGATSVTFNGTAAMFAVVSPSLITTTVPDGATTGTVQVVTPGSTLSSNVPFRVIQ